MANIAPANLIDKKKVMALWGEAFGTEEPYYSWYFNNIYRPERTFCLFVGSDLASVLQYSPYKLYFHGQEVEVAYLVGVCTARRYQRRGYAHMLLDYAISELRDFFKLLMLYTDTPGFYQPFGFTHCYRLCRYKFTASDDPTIPAQWYKGSLTDIDLDRYDAIYRKMTADFDGFIIRDKAGWRSFLGDYLCDKGGLYFSSDAYLLWIIEDGICKIKEIGYMNKSALEKSLDLGKHIARAHGFNNIIWEAPLATPLTAEKGDIFPHVMALSYASSGNSAQTAMQTKKLFGNSKKLWVNEIT